MVPCPEQICSHCKAARSDSAGGRGCGLPRTEPGEIRMHVPAPASRCLYFIHLLLQVTPEWEASGAKLMGVGDCAVPSATFQQPPPTHPPPPRLGLLVSVTKVTETGMSVKHILYQICLQSELVTESHLYREEAFSL